MPRLRPKQVSKSKSLEALARTRRGEVESGHPLAGSSSAAVLSGTAGAGSGGAGRLLHPVSLARDRVKHARSQPAFARLEQTLKAEADEKLLAETGGSAAAKPSRAGALSGGGDEDGKGPETASSPGRDGKQRRKAKTFTESLNLSARYMDEFVAGNFLYLRPKMAMERSAYDLETCEHWETDPNDYYTMSRAGITHFVGTDSEFTSLEQWEREYSLFNLIRKIPFFAKYRKWKNFTVWKTNVRSEKASNFSGALDDGLFFLNPTLRVSLMRLRRLCFEVSRWRLFEYNQEQTYTLDAFCDEQAVKRHHVITWLSEFADDVRTLVRGACDEVLDKFLADNSIQADHKMTFMERAALRTECRKLTKYIRLADFLVTDTLLGLALDSVATLDGFVRPAVKAPIVIRVSEDEGSKVATKKDREASPLFQVEVIIEEVLDETGEQAAEIARRRRAKREARRKAREAKEADEKEGGDGKEGAVEEKKGEEDSGDIIEADELVDDEDDEEDQVQLRIAPTVDDVKDRFRTLILEAMTVVSAPPRLLTHDDLSPYTQAATEDAEEQAREEVDLAEVVMADTTFMSTSETIYHGLETAFAEVGEFCKTFEPFKNTFLENIENLEDVKEQFRVVDLSVFEDAIAKYKGQNTMFGSIPMSADVGIVRVDSKRLKMALMPSPVRCLFAIQELLPVLMTEKAEKLLDELNSLNSVISSVPANVDDFVKKVTVLTATVDDLPNLRERRAVVMQMGSIMEQNGWPIPDSQKAYFTMLSDALTGLEQACSVSESKLDEDTKRFAQEVDEAVPQLKKDMLAVREKLDHSMIADPESNMEEVLDFLGKRDQEMKELKETAAKIQHWQSQLRMEVKDFETLDEVVLDLTLKMKLWEGLRDWTGLQESWVAMPFEEIDAEDLNMQVQVFMKTAVRAERGLPGNMAAPKLRAVVEEFKMLLPVVQDLRNHALKPRHWEEIESVINHEFDKEHTYTLGELLDLKVVDHQQEIQVITVKAVQESVLEDMFKGKVLDVWATMEFIVNPYKESKDVFILGSVEDVMAALDDSLVTINTILGSRYCAPIRDDVDAWQAKLMLLSETLDEWLICQKQWMYLETIFSAPDIQRQLPEEFARFESVDKSWKNMMRRTNTNPNCIASGTVKGMKETLSKHNEVLDQIQKSLEDYLETKRSAFPRFYFLSNDELLEILAQTRDPQAVQPHLRKCYDALVRLRFGAESTSVDIHAMISPEGEEVLLGRNLKARGNVEDWLTNVTNHMQASLQKLMKAGVLDYDETPRKDWVRAHPGQIVAAGAQIQWCRFTEEALRSEDPIEALAAWYDLNVAQLGDLTVLVRSKLTKLHRKIIVALVTTDVHARDIIEILRDDKVDTVSNFTWQMQLRYYWDTDQDTCIVRQSNCLIQYGFEYEGCTSRLVITPLTDRCWMTITGGLHLKLGASPAGPAGTGKTESSKDLAKAMAIQCIVFNCSDQIDYKMLGKLFSGLSQAGCWCCLDEFNRIDIEVLSVVAQQLLQLRQGRLTGATNLLFEGRNIKLNPHIVIVTMNPGYAGRTELPDNLKVLFRPVAMMVPDYALIAEIILFAEGFDDAKALSVKMTRLYRLSSEQLSQQRHYDFGMRAVKSVLVMAGALKRGNPGLSEDVVLIRAMRDSNVPKFLSPDLPLFHAIVGDLFPGVVVPHKDTGQLEVTLRNELDLAGLQQVDLFVDKIMQLYETFNVRFGVVITGPTGGGKTTGYEMLANAMTTLREAGVEDESFQKVHKVVLNPKCITMGELYGEFNELTQEWTDGLASSMIRDAVNMEDEDRRWTVFDGPIDALWIENMNTVLDDNMMLCLANGERIKLKPNMRMLFEVMDLEVASPATVSRLGVVFVTPDNLGWEPYVRSWLPREMSEKMSEEVRGHLLNLFLESFQDGLDFQTKNCSMPIQTTPVQLATSLCNLFTSMLRDAKPDFTRDAFDLNRMLTNLYAFSFLWTIGGCVHSDGWDAFDSFMRNHGTFDKVRFGAGSVYDNFFDTKSEDWRKWEDIMPAFEYDGSLPYFRLVVPTVDTVRYGFLLNAQARELNSMFFTGVTGTGKTVVVQDFLMRTSAGDYTGSTITVPIAQNFSARTTSADTQRIIEDKLQKKRKTLLGAPVGHKVVIFVDDINMPAVEEYGAQPPIELLRQFQCFKGFYDRERLFWKDVEDTVLMIAAAPPGGGRNPVTPRFSRHFHVVCMPPSTDIVLSRIFGSIIEGFAAAFNKDTQALCKPIVDSTIEVYRDITVAMRPTPAKSHYTFNLRDVSKVFQGVLQIRPQQCQSPDIMIRLWMHEACRVFHDRLISVEDKRWFTDALVVLLSKRFLKSGGEWNHEALFEERSMIFVDFLRPKMDDDQPGIYEEARDMTKIVNLLNDALDDYNMSNPTQMKLVFFRDAVEHVARITRILRQPRGNAMLVGVGGSGKQSLTRMACAISDVQCYTIELTRGYGLLEFREDLKKMMLIAGLEGKPLAFLFTDTQITNERFLEDVNNVLNTGEVPNLWENDELNKINEDLRPVATDAGIPETRDNIYRLFIARVRDNLHIVLAMSPVGDSLRVRCRQFPSLIDCTTIDWYMPWPRDALLSVANRFLNEVDLGSDEVAEGVASMCVTIHQSIDTYATKFFDELRRKVYTTPKSYLDLINLYIGMLGEKREELSMLRKRLAIGVNKLEETNAMVAGLQEELTKLQPVLDQKTKDTDALLIQVAADQKEADKVKAKVAVEEKEVRAYAAEVSEVQADAQRDLDVAMPALENAIKALDSLSKSDITEVKSFAKPPPAVQTVMEGVSLLLGEKTDWDTAKRLLGKSDFMQMLKDYDKDNIPASTLKKLKKYVTDPVMQVDNVKKVSKAATSLCMWVHAMDVYSKVAKEVEPKRKRLVEMNDKLNAANSQLKEKQDQLQAVLDKVAELKARLQAAQTEKADLLRETQLTKDRLERAEKLTVGLADEQVRWKASVSNFDIQINNLVGDVLLAAGSVSYYGAFTGVYRVDIVNQWIDQSQALKIPTSDDYSLQRTLGEPVVIRDWQIQGLPTDAVSTDNGILVSRGKRWPLMIDPQEQAKRWIKNMEAKNKLQLSRMNNPNLLRTLENCIRVGNPLMLEDIDEFLDPALEPVLARAVFKSGGRSLIHLGDSDIDYDPNFKLYMSTKMPNPHYLPEVCIKVTIINFTVTMDGLVDQLLGVLVKKERPDVEERKNRLVVSMAADKRQLQELEDKILKNLSESEGNILDDVVLIQTLGESKELSRVISERLKESEQTEIEINEMRDKYRPVAVRGSIVYFVIADLANIDPMYQYSLAYFVKLYTMCIDDSEKSSDLDVRLATLLDYLTKTVYTNVCRGLFESHKLLFSFLTCIQILREAATVTTTEWLLLLRGAGLLVNPLSNPFADQVPEIGWNLCHALEEELPDYFSGLSDHMTTNEQKWRDWLMGAMPHRTPLPAPWHEQLNSFQRMLVLKCLKEEKVLFAVKDYVVEQIGEHFVKSPPVLMADIHGDSDPTTPIIFVLSVGADPTGLLLNYAKKVDYADRLSLISLGQGQGPRAMQMVYEACKTGDWVLLQNCHLARSWMPDLEKIVDGLRDGVDISGNPIPPIDEGFRLWLTSMPTEYFPVPILQNGVKLTNEPPKGIRANLARSLSNMPSWTDFESCEGEFVAGGVEKGVEKIKAWKKLALGVCFFHANVQERRKFGPLGWNILYEFNDSDLETSILNLKMFLEEQPYVPWDALTYVTGQINYGGRVTDDWDRRCLMSILSRFYTPEILEDGYKFSPSGIYYAPEEAPLESYVDYIDKLPMEDDPEIFGMHENANIASQMQETQQILKTCLSIQPRTGGGGGGKSPDEVATELAQEIYGKLPKELELEDAGPNTFVMRGEHMDSLATVLSQEMVRYNKLTVKMKTSLIDLQRAIKGEVLMSDELDKMFTKLVMNIVPENWEAVAFPSLKPLASWVKDLQARLVFMRDWLENGQPGVFWMSGFFFPQGFMTGTLQNHARKYSQAIDTLGFTYEFLDVEHPEEVPKKKVPTDGVLVNGLFMDGARWDRDRKLLVDSNPGEMFSAMPIIHFIPKANYVPPPELYHAPTYKTSTRAGTLSTTGISTNYVIAVFMPSDHPPAYWVLKGVALLCQLDD